MMLSDLHEDLVLMWQELLAGWKPPTVVSKDRYDSLQRVSESSAERGWVGFAASYNGKWFGGYGPVAHNAGRDYLAESERLVSKKVSCIKSANAQVECADYRAIAPKRGDVVYLDPPYANTEGYAGTSSQFDSEQMWKLAASWHKQGVFVFVSEYKAPSPFVSILDNNRAATLAHQSSALRNKEGLFVYGTPTPVETTIDAYRKMVSAMTRDEAIAAAADAAAYRAITADDAANAAADAYRAAALAELMDSNLRMLNRIAELERDDRLNKARIEDMQTVNGSYVEMTNHRIAELEAEVLRVRDYAERMDALAEHRLIAVNIGELKRADEEFRAEQFIV